MNGYRNIPYRISKLITNRDWINHFTALLNPTTTCVLPRYVQPLIEIPILDNPITSLEIGAALIKLKSNKSPGPDGLPNEFFKHANTDLWRKILYLFNKILDEQSVPNCFQTAYCFPLYKKGDINSPNNYRGISFLNTIGKIFSSVILHRLTLWAYNENILAESQAGFRPHYSTMDNISVLLNLIDLRLAKPKQKLYVFFIDFTAAFDSINRSLLIYKLIQTGVSTKVTRLIENL